MESLHHIAGLNMTRIDHDAFRSLAHWLDSLFMKAPREVESDGFRDMALDEEPNPCDSEDVEEDGIE